MTTKKSFKHDAQRSKLQTSKHPYPIGILSVFWTHLQPQRKVSVTSADFGSTKRGATLAQGWLKFAAVFLLIFTLGIGNAWGLTASDSWDLTSASGDWSGSNYETYFSQPYGMKKVNAYIQATGISDFTNYASLATSIKIGVKSLQNGGTTSVLTVYLLDKDGAVIGSGQTITPVNASSASSTTYQYVTFSSSLSSARGFQIKCTTFGKNILINGASYEITYTATNYTVNWQANGVDWTGSSHGNPSTSAASGSKVATLPTAPTSAACDNSKVFVGWTNASYSHATDAPTILFSTVEDAPAVTGDVTYYAVFATSSGSGVGRVEVNTDNSGVTGSYADLDFTVSGIRFKTNQWMKSTNIQAKKDNTYSIYNVTGFAGNITSIKVKQTGTARAVSISGSNYFNEEEAEAAGDTYVEETITQPSTAATMTFSFAGKAFKYFYMSTPGNAVYMDSIVIRYSSITYTNYATSCCTALGTINGSINRSVISTTFI